MKDVNGEKIEGKIYCIAQSILTLAKEPKQKDKINEIYHFFVSPHINRVLSANFVK